ncbi:MAG: MarR family transcriptional regulator [Paracoccaceae bacterium]|tara:strand:+ start:1861 stop:2298 length:438 start_codon:yes stop_codon:yes gene_type:complete
MNYVDINEVPAFSTSLPMQLYKALDAIMPEYRNLFYKYDLTEQQWRILRVLWTENNITVAQLSKITLLPAPSLVGILDRLVKKNLLIRNRSDKDRRQVQISLTTKGQELQQLVAPSVLAIHSRLKARVSNDEWQSLERLLKKFSV